MGKLFASCAGLLILIVFTKLEYDREKAEVPCELAQLGYNNPVITNSVNRQLPGGLPRIPPPNVTDYYFTSNGVKYVYETKNNYQRVVKKI